MIARVGRREQSRDERRGKKREGFRFKYKPRSSEDVKKRAEQSGGNFDSPIKRGFDMWRPKSGENVIRILPPTWEDFDHYGYDVFMHRFVGSDNSNYICPNKMRGKPCCMCDEAKTLKADGEEEEAKQIGFQKRVWVWIIDRDDKNALPQIWDMSWSQDRTISEQSQYKGGKVLLIDHPDDGFDVIVKKTGSGKTGTKYTFTIERDSSPIHEDQDKQDEILQFITENPVPTTLKLFDNDYLAKKMEGTSSSKDEDLDEDEDSGKKRKRNREEDEGEDDKPRRRKPRDAEGDEEQDDPPRRKRPREDAEEEDEDAAPRRGSRRREEPEDEEEDDPPPRKKRAARDAEAEEDEEEDRPKKRRSREEPEDEEDEPAPKKKRRVEEEDEEDDPPPRKKRRAEEDEEEDDRPRRRK